MIPLIRVSHQPSVSLRIENAMMMSNVPAKTRKKLITAASAANVSPGWMNETMPAAMKQLRAAGDDDRHRDLEQAGEDGDDSEEDRDRPHRRVVEPKDDQADQHPGAPRDEEDPPWRQETSERSRSTGGKHRHGLSLRVDLRPLGAGISQWLRSVNRMGGHGEPNAL